jgi:hypothetical protein
MRLPRGICVAMLAVPVVLALLLGTTGCGTQRSEARTGPDRATLDCRQQWSDLGDTLRGRDAQTTPSALADRWNSVIATIDYYADSATAHDCSTTLSGQRTRITQLEEFSARLHRFDVGYLMSDVAGLATDYLARPLPPPRRLPAKAGHKTAKGKQRVTTVKPPSKAEVRAALTSLQKDAELSVADMQAGWQEANAIDLSDPAQQRKAVKDLTFLAGDSTPFQASLAAIRLLREAVQFGEPRTKATG